LDADWGSIQILIYPAGTAVPADKAAPPVSSPIAEAVRPVQVTAAAVQKQ
jgi:hypothetical protein